jgi:hypothetical protein
MEEVVATAPTKLAPFRKKSRRAELVVSVIKNGMGVMMCDVCESDGYHVESFVSERNDDVPVFMVMDDHAEAEPRRKKDKHNFIVVSNNTIN